MRRAIKELALWPIALAAVLPCQVAFGNDPAVPTRAAEGVYVGPLPDAAAWQRLKELGIRTAVGVDGLPPDSAAARQHGISVVHIPIGYDGIDPHAAGQLARVAAESPRPIYVYCHHGKHRGPAAAAVICRAGGLLNRQESLALLTSAGTSRRYAGLWRDVTDYRPPKDIDRLPPLAERSEVTPLRLAMSQLDRAWDQLAQATNEAQRKQAETLVSESLRESRRAAEAQHADQGLIDLVKQSETSWSAIRQDASPVVIRSFQHRCTDCHQRFRDRTAADNGPR